MRMNVISAWRGEEDLENFNVRVFFDKLEDQNLHLASQLARHQDDLHKFYSRISGQNDDLRNMLNSLDLSKLEEIEQQKREQGDAVDRDQLQQHGDYTGDILLADVHKHYKLTG